MDNTQGQKESQFNKPAAKGSVPAMKNPNEKTEESESKASAAVANIPAQFHSLYFRYRITSGNNGTLVKNVMKLRSWWYARESTTFASNRKTKAKKEDDNEHEGYGPPSVEPTYFDDINFLWTQWRR